MFKSLWSYIFVILLIAGGCSFILFSIEYNPFDFSDDIIRWIIRLFIYMLIASGFIQIYRKEEVVDIGLLSIIIPILALLINEDWTSVNLLKNITDIHIISWYTSSLIISLWLFYILLTKSKTILDILILLNVVVSIFILLPYGIPNLNFSVFPIYTLENYTPFTHESNCISYLLDIRILSSLIFVLYLFIISFLQIKKLTYLDKLEKSVKDEESSVFQFFMALAYFIWNLIQIFAFYVTEFFKAVWNVLLDQMKKSLNGYIYSVNIAFAFLAPFIIFYLSNLIFEYNKNVKTITLSTDYFIIVFLQYLRQIR